ncbi:MAG TPA: apolipoprotein N-acyltransferase, partial [Stellaceae bacterium]|nr:apolipoprotein N-acyltransferase [Stellaceae bacterium]
MAEPQTHLALRAVGPLAPLQRARLWCVALTGWRRYLVALVLGAMAALVFSPVNSVPAALVAFPGLVWLFDGTRTRRSALALGWYFGYGFFLAGLHWITAALFVDIAQYGWLLPVVLFVFPGAILAPFVAVCLLGAYEICRRFHLGGSPRIIVLTIAWTTAEWLRGHLFTGFPWNLMGYAWAGEFPGALAVLQVASIVGIYGLSLITVLAAALPARLGDLGGNRLWAIVAAVLLIAVPAGWGSWRLAHADNRMVPGVMLRLVQPSIPETLKNDPDEFSKNFQLLLALTEAPSSPPITDVIWPEAAAPPVMERFPGERQAIAKVLPKGGLLLTGAERGEPLEGPIDRAWNSLDVVNDKGEIIATYDKTHLVPMGEYVPFRHYLPVDKVVPSIHDFSFGTGPKTLDLPGLPPVSPLICYEAIFPGAVIDPEHRPKWLLNVTNDAWYGRSVGPFQHAEIARTRAVEEGLPLVRAANNGISEVADAYGRYIRPRLGIDEVGVLDAPLPEALPPTPYESVRGQAFWIVSLLMLAMAILVS